MGFMEGDFDAKTHMCLIYQSEAERRSLIEPFIVAASDDNDRVEYFYDEWSADDMRRALSKYGIDAKAAEKSGQIRLRHTATVYHPKQVFAPEAMWQTLCDCYDCGLRDGFARVR
ncbi:MAG: MEDS domain-containing protein, partial [Pseudomonadota bacterium]